MLETFIKIVHIFVCAFLMLVVLLQQGKGGGMGAAFGGSAQQVFGGRGAGNILTRATSICAVVFMLTSVGLAYISSSGDRAMTELVKQKEAEKPTLDKGQAGHKRSKEDAPPSPSNAPAPTQSAPPQPTPDTPPPQQP